MSCGDCECKTNQRGLPPQRDKSKGLHILQYAIYMATIDYMVAAYGPYTASATDGNGFVSDFLAGIAALYAVPRE